MECLYSVLLTYLKKLCIHQNILNYGKLIKLAKCNKGCCNFWLAKLSAWPARAAFNWCSMHTHCLQSLLLPPSLLDLLQLWSC